jgi:hypothetical protein
MALATLAACVLARDCSRELIRLVIVASSTDSNPKLSEQEAMFCTLPYQWFAARSQQLIVGMITVPVQLVRLVNNVVAYDCGPETVE